MDKGDESAIEAALVDARLAEVGAEDLGKAEQKLAEVKAMTPEQKAAKRRAASEAIWKKEAFLLVKKDDDGGLKAFIEGLEEGVRWQDWKDYAGRTLWRAAQELKSGRAQQYLAPKLGLAVPEEQK